jgi:hypothetical protein
MIRFFKKIIRNLKVFFLAVFVSFLFLLMFTHPIRPAFFLGEKLSAAVGVSNYASVPVNPINKLAMQLEEKDKELQEKEKFLDERALALERENSVLKNKLLLAILVAIVSLFFMLLVNFYFDSKRNKELKEVEKSGKLVV